MEIQVFPWIDDDVAIEIIGKMIVDQNRSLIGVLNAFKNVGLGRESREVQINQDYQYHSRRIKELNAEIRQIYRGENRDQLIQKAYNDYAPYIKGRMKLLHSVV
jgi:hypothetical protein